MPILIILIDIFRFKRQCDLSRYDCDLIDDIIKIVEVAFALSGSGD